MALPRPIMVAIAAATVAALVLRIAAATGGLWLDEAWSAVFAREAGTAIGALRIGHDNNHLLNTWWLQLVGWPAPPLAMRALSIASGTAAVPVAAAIAARRDAGAAALAAWLFALSPVLVTYGSEARGYAPMLLALLVAIRLIDRAIEGRAAPSLATGIALAIGIGTLAQLTILFALPALVGWVLWAFRGNRPFAATLGLLGPALLVAAILTGAIVGGGITVGSYQPFAIGLWAEALGDLARYTLAIGWLSTPVLLAATVAGTFAFVIARADDPMAALVLLGTLVFPIAVALLGIGNSGLARYYLIAAAILLLAIAQAPRAAALPLTIIVAAGSLLADLDLIANRRADPAQAVAAMARLSPTGGRFGVEASRDAAVIEVAAAQAGYRAAQSAADCPAPEFLFVTRDGDAPFPIRPTRCGTGYLPAAGERTTGLSGNHWQLYLRTP